MPLHRFAGTIRRNKHRDDRAHGRLQNPLAQNDVRAGEPSRRWEARWNKWKGQRLALMDQALHRALSKYESCQTSQASNSSSNTAPSASAAANMGAAAGGSGSDASSDMTGTEPPLSHDSAANSGGTAQPGMAAAGRTDRETTSGGGTPRIRSATVTNGKAPEDIPPAENDSALEAQIRQAAINEKDPNIKAKLWNEYRKYKGLPLVH